MSRSHRLHNNVAFVEDCPDDVSSIEGFPATRVYATSEAPSAPSKPLPNSSKSRSNDRYRPSPARRGESSTSNSDSTTHSKKAREAKRENDARQKEYEREERRRKDEKREKDARRVKAAEDRAAKESSKALKKIRPPPGPRHATLPVAQHGPKGSRDDPRAYGIPLPPGPAGPRPRASSRPASYYAGQQPPRPPPGWSHGPGMPPAPFPVGTFPPPPQMYAPGPPLGMHMPMPSPSPSNAGSYLDGPPPPMMHGRDLRHRFDPRPSSAIGFSPSQRSYLAEEYGFEDERPPHMARRPSHTRVHEDDRKRMPPPDFIPARPRTTASPSTPFNPPPQRPASRHGHPQLRPKGFNRRSIGVYDRPEYDDEEDLFGADDLFHDNSPEPAYGQRRAAAARSRHHVVYDDDEDDEDDDDDEEFDVPLPVSRISMGRRGSVHTAALGSGGVSLERDRYLDAMRYQDDLGVGAPMPLTAETLRKASKRGDPASSRSTRSSDSRDESEYKRSHTTGITRSSTDNPDDLTIKFSGAAVVRFEGAEIECDDGEITFSNRNGTTRVGSGSDRASTVYQLEDGRSRAPQRKALPHRPRAPSQSDTQSRYAPSHAPYPEHAPYDPTFSYY